MVFHGFKVVQEFVHPQEHHRAHGKGQNLRESLYLQAFWPFWGSRFFLGGKLLYIPKRKHATPSKEFLMDPKKELLGGGAIPSRLGNQLLRRHGHI